MSKFFGPILQAPLNSSQSFQHQLPVLWAWYRLFRPINLVITAMAQALANALLAHFDGYLSALTRADLLYLMGATALIGAGGNAINALMDRDADNAHAPGSNPVGRELDLKSAGIAYGATSVGGMAMGLQLATRLEHPGAMWWMPLAVVLLFLYSWRMQGWPLAGNVVVAFLSALAVALPALFRPDGWPLMETGAALQPSLPKGAALFPSASCLGGFLVLAFLASWIREWIKDLEDADADRSAGRRTAAVRWPLLQNKAWLFALVALQLGAVFALAYGMRQSSIGLAASLPALPIAIGYAALGLGLGKATRPEDYGRLSLWSKALMGTGVLWMGILPLLA